jgi:neutral ceramidase
MNVRDRSPFPHTFYFGYANGWLGYLATRQAFAAGGYETRTNPFTQQVEDDLTNVVTAYLEGHRR